MLTNVEQLQRALYGDWEMYDPQSRNDMFCRFCRAGQPALSKERHTEDCPRLEFIIHFYGVKPYKPQNSRYTSLAIDGKEFARSGIYGWWNTKKEFKALLSKALDIEKERN